MNMYAENKIKKNKTRSSPDRRKSEQERNKIDTYGSFSEKKIHGSSAATVADSHTCAGSIVVVSEVSKTADGVEFTSWYLHKTIIYYLQV